MRGCINHIKISGLVTAVPKNREDNVDYIEKIESRRIRKQIILTGINERRVCINGQKASDLATVAADTLLKKLNWDRTKIDVLIFVTQSPELSRPSTAFMIQNRLAVGQECLVYDINLGCSGFVGGIQTIAAILQVTKGKGLLLVGESHALENGEINSSSLLTGDAASALALEYSDAMEGSIVFRQYSDGSRAEYIYKCFNRCGYMDGNAVLLFGLNEVTDSIKTFIQDNGLEDDDIDFYVLHQAQKMIIDGIAKGADLPAEKMLVSCDLFGNTSSASIPLTINLHLNNEKNTGTKKLLLCGFGIGLSWGIVAIDMECENIFPIMETDYVYEDREKFGL